MVGAEQRLFAAHEEVLCNSPFFGNAIRNSYMDASTKRIALPDEEPEIFSSVLEYLYKGDYFPRLVHNKRRNSWELEPPPDDDRGGVESTVYHRGIDGDLLKDTVIYCAAQRYGLDELKKLALRKQGLRKSHHDSSQFRPHSHNKQSQASNAAQSLRRHATPTQTRQMTTPSSEHTTWLSSSAHAAPSSAAGQCSWRCTTAAHSFSLTFLSHSATMSMTSHWHSE